MRKFRAAIVVAALACVALLVPSTAAQAAQVDDISSTRAVQLNFGWTG